MSKEIHVRFKVTLSGYGKDVNAAWNDAVESFSQDPGSPEDDDYEIDKDYEGEEIEDDT